MIKRSAAGRVLLAIALCVVCSRDARALGPVGHYFLARWYAEQVALGKIDAPPELKLALQDPVARATFCGGAMAPDFAGDTEPTHQGTNGDRAKAMLEEAQAHLASARTPAEQARAGQELAFSYGWLAHLAADDVVHPRINLAVGDTYRHLNGWGRARHAEWERQVDQIIYRAVDPSVPLAVLLATPVLSEFASRHFGPIGLANGAELAETMGGVYDTSAFGQLWPEGEAASVQEQWSLLLSHTVPLMQAYINRPQNLTNGDRDGAGGLTGAEYDALRKEFLAAQGKPADTKGIHLFRELAASIRPLASDVVVMKEELAARLPVRQQVVDGLEDAAGRLDAFRRKAGPIIDRLRSVLAECHGLVEAVNAGRPAAPASAPAACGRLADLAAQAGERRLSLAVVDAHITDTVRTLGLMRTGSAAGRETAARARSLQDALALAAEQYRDAGAVPLLAGVQVVLDARAASVDKAESSQADCCFTNVSTTDLVARFRNSLTQLRSQLRLLSTVPVYGDPPLLDPADDEFAKTSRVVEWADAFAKSDLFTKYGGVDRAALDRRFQELQAAYDEVRRLDTEARDLVEQARAQREALRAVRQAFDEAPRRIAEAEACLEQLRAMRADLSSAATPATPVPSVPAVSAPAETAERRTSRVRCSGGDRVLEEYEEVRAGNTWVKDGPYRQWHCNTGNPGQTGTYVKGRWHGEYRSFHSDGVLADLIVYDHGRKVTWTRYVAGKPSERTYYDQDGNAVRTEYIKGGLE